eukprot:1183384-Prorocentrum_minimum.AAC.4
MPRAKQSVAHACRPQVAIDSLLATPACDARVPTVAPPRQSEQPLTFFAIAYSTKHPSEARITRRGRRVSALRGSGRTADVLGSKLFPRTNQTQESQVCSHDGPIRRTADVLEAELAVD